MATDSSPARDDARSRARAAQRADVMRLAARREGSGGRRESGRSADDGRHGAAQSQPWRAHARHDTAERRGGRRRRRVLDRRDCRRRTGREESRHARAGKTGADGAGKHGERRVIWHRGRLPAAGRSVKRQASSVGVGVGVGINANAPRRYPIRRCSTPMSRHASPWQVNMRIWCRVAASKSARFMKSRRASSVCTSASSSSSSVGRPASRSRSA